MFMLFLCNNAEATTSKLCYAFVNAQNIRGKNKFSLRSEKSIINNLYNIYNKSRYLCYKLNP